MLPLRAVLTEVGAALIRASISFIVALGLACLSAAAHAATMGDACEVPAKLDWPPLKPVEVTNAPAAIRSSVPPRLLKQVICLAAVVASVQPNTVALPTLLSQLAPTPMVDAMQAGELLLVLEP